MDPNGSTLRWRRLQGELPVLLLETALGKQKTPLEQRVRETWWKPCHSWCSPGGLETSHPKRYSFLGKSNFPFIYIARENPGWWNKLAKKKMLVHELRAFFHRCVLVQHPTQEKETSQYWIYLLRCVFFRWFFTDWDPMGVITIKSHHLRANPRRRRRVENVVLPIGSIWIHGIFTSINGWFLWWIRG